MFDLLFENKNILDSIPDGLRIPLFEAYNEIQKNYRENRWEPSELNGGKLCEIIYAIIKGYADGNYPANPSKPQNMLHACQNMEKESQLLSRSIRIQIPRMIIALYEIRNNRGVGHSGGDVNPNHMDANSVLYMSKWLMSELVRLFHNVDTITATKIIDSVVERKFSVIWEVNGKKRILNQSMTMKDKTLLLLYQSNDIVQESELIKWLEHSNPSVLRRDIFRVLHKNKYIEYDESIHTLQLSPKGIKYVEESIELEI